MSTNIKKPPKTFSDLYVTKEDEVKDGEQVDEDAEREQTYERGQYYTKPFRHFFMVKTSGVTTMRKNPFIPTGQVNIVYHLEVICRQKIVHMHGVLETFLPVTLADLEAAYPDIQFSTIYDMEGAFDYIEYQRVKVLCEEGKPLSIATAFERLYYPRKGFMMQWAKAGYNAFETGFYRFFRCSDQVYRSMMKYYNEFMSKFRKNFKDLKGDIPGFTSAILLEQDSNNMEYGDFQNLITDRYMQLKGIGTEPETEIVEIDYNSLSSLTLADTNVRELPAQFVGPRMMLLKVDQTLKPEISLSELQVVKNKLLILANGLSILGVYYKKHRPHRHRRRSTTTPINVVEDLQEAQEAPEVQGSPVNWKNVNFGVKLKLNKL